MASSRDFATLAGLKANASALSFERPQGRLGSDQLTPIPRDPLCGRRDQVLSVLHGRTPQLLRRRACATNNDVSYWGRSQGLSGPAAELARAVLLTQSSPLHTWQILERS